MTTEEKARITRILAMEERFDRVSEALASLKEAADAFERCKPDIEALEAYQSSGQWLADYEYDEAGELPGFKRGVLSQDGLYELLSDAAETVFGLREQLG
jgi:hypothetical protein